MINKELLKAEAPFLDNIALERFDKYAEMLVFWNERINLTAIIDPEEITKKHFLDSLAIFNYIDIPKKTSLIDIGTGAGFPGLALLIAKPDLEVTLLDSTKKKLFVIEEILRELELDATLLHMRAEEAGQNSKYREKFDFATARAVANLSVLSEYCLPFTKINGTFISLKGAESKNEIIKAQSAINVLGGKLKAIHEFQLNNEFERTIIEIKKNAETASKYPRSSSLIKKKPL